jgi:tRNA-Thr(GGU) m(6)t(6)A37 methyltransferase TsaA
MTLKPIGVIRAPFLEAKETPIQAALCPSAEALIELFPEFVPGLKDLEGFDRVWILCWLHQAAPARMVITPFLDDREHGVFATRSPSRPNPISLSCVRLLSVNANSLRIGGVDMLDQTPVLDIKPYVPAFDSFESKRIGWFENKELHPFRADNRFQLPH